MSRGRGVVGAEETAARCGVSLLLVLRMLGSHEFSTRVFRPEPKFEFIRYGMTRRHILW